MPASAKVITDVTSPYGDRLVIQEAVLWRPILAELNTHRSHSRSSASSRAIPISKQLAKINRDPAYPVYWAAEQPGMQAGAELDGDDLTKAMDLVLKLESDVVGQITEYLDSIAAKYPDPTEAKAHTLHKSLLARYIEPWMWHTVIFGATDDGWDNFFTQRATRFSDGAQPEMRACADAMLEAYESSKTVEIGERDWVTPYIRDEDDFSEFENPDLTRCKVSTARCARVSYLSHDGVRDINEDIRMYEERLYAPRPRHSAPMEFVCTPDEGSNYGGQVGNFTGYRQFRHIVEQETENIWIPVG